MSRLDSRNFDPLKIEKVGNLSLATYHTLILIDEMSNADILLLEYFTRTYLFSSLVTYIDSDISSSDGQKLLVQPLDKVAE